MADIFNEDFAEYIELLNKHDVEYILVGGIAVNIYGYRRATGDMDIFVNPTKKNHSKISKVHYDFGMHMGEMESLENFLDSEKFDVYTFGMTPIQIDIMTQCKGIDFAEINQRSNTYKINNTINVKVIHINDLMRAKKESARPRDLADIHELEKIRNAK